MRSRRVSPDALSLVFPPAASRSAPGRRTVTDMSSLPKRGAEISVSPISYQHDDTAGFFPCHSYRCCDRGTAGRSGEDAFLSREALRHRERLLRRHHAVLVRDALVPDRRPECRRHVLPPFDAVHRLIGLHRHDANTFGSKRPRDADDRPGRADAGDEMRDAPTGLLPNLRRGPELVRQRVRRVRVLIDVDISVRFRGGAPLRFADRAVRALERIGEDELRAKRARDPLALERYLVRHAELERMAAHGAVHREGNT